MSTAGASVTPRRVFGVALGLGSVVRALPMLDFGGRMLQQWPTEDGYLTLTIARNIALGHGFSVADGTIGTNGTQPLVTLVYAVGFWLAGGDRDTGVLLAQVWQLVVAVATACLFYRFVRTYFREAPGEAWTACTTASLWFVGPVLARHTMNCLETGTVLLLSLVVVERWYRFVSDPDRPPRDLGTAAKIGLWMGLTAWGRIDSVFLMVALGLSHLMLGWRLDKLRAAIAEVSVMAAVAGPSISPWLLYGKLSFGYWMPISGIAESSRTIGDHAILLPTTLFEYVNGVAGLPPFLEKSPIVVVSCTLGLLGWIGAAARAASRGTVSQQAVAWYAALLACLLGGYYGVFFGAAHFLSRYLAPLSFPIVGFTAWCMVYGLRRVPMPWVRGAIVGAVAVLVVAQHARIYRRGVPHPHWAVVQWVHEHVDEATWLGAIQTGTLGFFHARTLNLDGKVDPRALASILGRRHHEYIVESPAQALVDWAGLRALAEDGDVVSGAFALRVYDEARNLGVLVRRGGPLDDGEEIPVESRPRTSPH